VVPCDDVRVAGNDEVAPRLEHRLLLLEAVYLFDVMSVFIGRDAFSGVYLPDAMRFCECV